MIDYELALIILDTLFYGVIIIMMALSWFYVAGFFLSMKRIKKAPHSDKYTKFAILIPARNEGDVVKNIMHALKDFKKPVEKQATKPATFESIKQALKLRKLSYEEIAVLKSLIKETTP